MKRAITYPLALFDVICMAHIFRRKQ